ncbi:MAG: anaerobic sulfatase maturase [Candidatus Aminicenantales bacterium]
MMMDFKRQKISSVLIKPAGPDCNMACAYCFYLKKASLFPQTRTHRMSEEMLEKTVRQVLQQGGPEVSFGWQGGEPTLMGLEFYRKAVRFQKAYGRGQTVGNGLQTNGLLITKEWADFLREYRFLVGLSLDGPAHIHDRYRRLPNGKGSWALVSDRAKLLLDNDVAVNALVVVNDYSVAFPEDIYEFHKSLGLRYMQFIPCVEPDPEDPSRTAPFSVPPRAYGEFLCRLFDLWIADFDGTTALTSIRFFDSVFHVYAGLRPPECTLLRDCGVYVVVEHNGEVFACDFFVEPAWKLGHIREGRLVDMLNSSLQRRFGRQKSRLSPKCRTCRWLRYCRGGCPKDRLHNPQDQTLSRFCLSYEMFFAHADARFRKLAKAWKSQQQNERQQQEKSVSSDRLFPRVGRNDPCPCGSGLKFKKCCGRTRPG